MCIRDSHFSVILIGFGLQFWSFLALWRVSGPSLGHLGCPQHGSRERKACSLDPPWLPKMRSFLHRFSMFFWIKNALIFDWILVSILGSKWCENESKNHHFFDKKTSLIFEWFFMDFLDGFLEPKSLKMSTSCWRDAHFRKIVLFNSGTILEQKMM